MKIIYRAVDGTEFDSKAECESYEKEVNKFKKFIVTMGLVLGSPETDELFKHLRKAIKLNLISIHIK